MHIQLPITETVHLMGSDAVEGFGPPLKLGNNFHVSRSPRERERASGSASTPSGYACAGCVAWYRRL
ncbi:MAG TPA: hypothetical protein VN894_19980, partial [Polyangiaceae bacterium]|nr:hypothetical protein [Polyangiaceae bacterium]